MTSLTEAELIEAATTYFGLNAEMLTLYLTATSGFLLVAYLVAPKLTRYQLATVSGLYLVFALIATYLAIGYALRGMFYIEQLRSVSPETPVFSTNVIPAALGTVLFAGIIASLLFMSHSRRLNSA